MLNAKQILLVSLSVFSFFVVASLSANSAFAGWTCCTAGNNDCNPNGSPNCANIPSCGVPAGTCPGGTINGCCPTEIKSEQCGAGKVADACSTSTGGQPDGILCKYAAFSPNSITLKINQSYGLTMTAWNNGNNLITSFSTSSTIPGVATASPARLNICCSYGTYGSMTVPSKVTVTALREGTTSIIGTLSSDQTSSTCSAAARVTVSGIVPLLACVPGAKCVSSTATYAVGSNVTCSMPAAADLSKGTPTYSVRCTPYKGTVAQNVVVINSSTTTFKSFKIATGVTNVKCTFRYCQTDSAGYTVCSAWGTV